MSALESLLRLYRWQVDERRRHLGTLEALDADLDAEQRRLDGEVAREGVAGAASPEAAGHAGRLVERRRTLAQSRTEVAQQIEGARAALAEAVQEVKRHEAAVATRARRQEQRDEQRDQPAHDDQNTAGFRRRRAGQE